MCVSPVVSRSSCFLGIPSPLVLTIFLPPFLHSFLSPKGEGFNEDIPFRTEYSKLSYSLNIVWMWVSVRHLLQEEVTLMMDEQDIDL